MDCATRTATIDEHTFVLWRLVTDIEGRAWVGWFEVLSVAAVGWPNSRLG